MSVTVSEWASFSSHRRHCAPRDAAAAHPTRRSTYRNDHVEVAALLFLRHTRLSRRRTAQSLTSSARAHWRCKGTTTPQHVTWWAAVALSHMLLLLCIHVSIILRLKGKELRRRFNTEHDGLLGSAVRGLYSRCYKRRVVR
jgi:hypothetical protein